MKSYSDFGINVLNTASSGGETYATCPQCSPKRKKQNIKCLSVNIEKGVWHCHHCEWKGSLKSGEDRPSVRPKIRVKPQYAHDPVMRPEAEQFFRIRGIPLDLLLQEKISCQEAYMPTESDFIPCLLFPFVKNGEVVNVKYRGLREKCFRQVTDAEKVLYRQDHIAKKLVVVVEGEIDALSILLAGIDSVVSVPDGAPSPKAKAYASKFEFLDQDPDPFAEVEQIVLAVDNDEAGGVLRDELARRFGRDRCWQVTWPDECKDANDVLRKHGAEELRRCIEAARPWPIEDVITIDQIAEKMVVLANTGLPKGLSTGWPELDQVFTIAPGQLTIVTGIPSHGKSQFVDSLAINLCQLHGWRFAICSPEHHPVELHAVNLMEKWANRTVRRKRQDENYPPGVYLFKPSEMGQAIEEMNESLALIAPAESMSIPALLDRATSLVKRRGIQGLIIDPFNEFDHTRKGQSEVEYINDTVGNIRRWGRKWSVHTFVVAHPTKMLKDDLGNYPVPTPYDISGGAVWRNKADNCLTVWRDMLATDFKVEIHIQKVKWRNLGHAPEKIDLTFEPWTGRYRSVFEPELIVLD